MENLVHQLKSFSKQIGYSLAHYTPHKIPKSQISNIVIGGLGGSGIGGKIVKNYFANKIDLPVDIVSDYIFPRYINSNTLVILSSYSGNSEETLALFSQAKERNSKVLVLSSGGLLEELALKDNYPFYKAEPGLEARMALGYSLTYLLLIFFELLGQYKDVDLKKIGDSVSIADNFMAQAQKLIAPFKDNLQNKFIVVCDPPFEGIATRLVQQIQENAKLEAFISVLPEANHNTLATYGNKIKNNYIFLNSRSSHQTSLRFGFLKNLLVESPILELGTMDDHLSTIVTTLYSLDWLSIEIAKLTGADVESSKNVIDLKSYLKKNSTKS